MDWPFRIQDGRGEVGVHLLDVVPGRADSHAREPGHRLVFGLRRRGDLRQRPSEGDQELDAVPVGIFI